MGVAQAVKAPRAEPDDDHGDSEEGEEEILTVLEEVTRLNSTIDELLFLSRAEGRSITLDGTPHTIVGVLPRSFEFAPSKSSPLWVPLHPAGDLGARRSLRWFNVIARLAPGVSPELARAETPERDPAAECPRACGSEHARARRTQRQLQIHRRERRAVARSARARQRRSGAAL